MSPTLAETLGMLAPWTALAALLGLANGSLFVLIAGRSALRLPLYLLCGAAAAALVQPAGLLLAPASPLLIGEVSLPLVTAAVWLVLFVARLLGL
jgi:hypothetical protein